VGLNLKGRQLLIVGSGEVAFKRYEQWVGRGAHILVVGLQFCHSFKQVAHEPELTLEMRSFESTDLEGRSLVYIATHDSDLNAHIETLCKARRILCCRADASDSDFHTLSLIEQGAIQIGIGTSGQSPAVAQEIRMRIEEALPLETLERKIELMAVLKQKLKNDVSEQSTRGLLLKKALVLTIDELEGLLSDEAIYNRFKG
jgi:precorrin-2 dehydrogenase/sirohydrochlorin ferrochelatase